MLGSRYGWAQPREKNQPRDELLARTHEAASSQFSWIRKYSDRSVTELEIRHAVLNDPQTDTGMRALFLLRKNGARDDDPRLTALKDELSLCTSTKILDYSEASKLRDSVYSHLCTVISNDFPLKDLPTLLEKERMAHEAFQETRAGVYIGRQYYFDAINAHLAKPNCAPFVVIGRSGSGKSAFMANWTVQYRDSHPSALVVAHYIGSTAASTDLGRLMQRVMQEIDQFYDLNKAKEIPTEFKDIVDAFPKWLGVAGQRGGIVLVLDALNQLDPSNNAMDLAWLPAIIPPNVKLVVSTLPGRALEVLVSREWKTLEIQPLSTSERRTLVQEYLAIFSKKLTERQLERIVNAVQCENPLFLRTLLEEIRVFGSFEKLDSHIDHYLTATTPPELFVLVFTRLERDFEREQPGLVGDVLSFLWVSRRGLTETELLDVIGVHHGKWSPLYLALSESVVSKSGFLSFFHDYMRQAVESRYLKPNRYLHYRERLCKYFLSEKSQDPHRKYEEAPYLMESGAQWSELRTFITALDNFTFMLERQYKFDLYRYWRSVAEAGLDPDGALMASLARADSSSSANVRMEAWSRAANFFQDIGSYQNAEDSARKALAEAERNVKDISTLSDKWQQLAYVLRLRGKYTEAAPLYEKALDVHQNNPNIDKQVLANSINSLAILYRLQGKYDKAEPLYTKALQIRKSLFGDVHEDVAQSLNSLGCLNQDMGRYPIAEQFLKESIRQREQLCGSNHPDVAMSLNNLGGLYIDWSKYILAEPIYKRAKAIYELVFGGVHPYVAKCINNLAGLYQEQGKYAQAEEMYKQCVSLKRQLLGNDHPDLALTMNDFAVLYARQDKYLDAERMYTEAMQIRARVLGRDHPDYAQSLKNMASLYQDQRRYDEALPLFQQALNITTTVFGEKHQDVATSLSGLAGCYQLMQQFDNALPLYERALRIQQELMGPNHADVALTLNDMAVLNFKKRDYTKAEELYMRALKTYENVFGTDHPHTGQATLNVAQFFKGIRSFEKAIKFYKQAKDIFASQYGENHAKTLGVIQELQDLE